MSLTKLKPQKQTDPLFPIIISVVVCSVLMVYPFSYNVSGWRPQLMLLVALFWVMCQPTWCGVWFAFSIGLFTDLLIDAPLGLNALIFVCITFVARFFTRERRVMTFGNLWIISTLAIIIYLALMFVLQVIWGVSFHFSRHWQPLITTILAWPILYYVLKKWRI